MNKITTNKTTRFNHETGNFLVWPKTGKQKENENKVIFKGNYFSCKKKVQYILTLPLGIYEFKSRSLKLPGAALFGGYLDCLHNLFPQFSVNEAYIKFMKV